VKGLAGVKEAYLCNLGRGELIGMAKVEGSDEEEIKKFVNNEIRGLDSVNSTGIPTIRGNLEDAKSKEEERIIEEEEEEEREENWGPWGPIRQKRG